MEYVGSRTDAKGNVINTYANYGTSQPSAEPTQAQQVQSLMSQIQSNSSANMAWSAQQAANQMNFQRQMQNLAMQYNSAEAAKNRDWQEYMSNSAHQREVADLKAAGLNPILSASGGNGAAVTSGATAAGVSGAQGASGQIDSSANNALASILGTWISSLTSLENMRVSAQSNEAVADKYNAMTKYVSELTDVRERELHSETLTYQYYATVVNDALQRYVSDNALEGTKIKAAADKASASIYARAQMYGADKQYSIAQLQAETQKELQKQGFSYTMIEKLTDYVTDDLLQSDRLKQEKSLTEQKIEAEYGQRFISDLLGIGRGAASAMAFGMMK